MARSDTWDSVPMAPANLSPAWPLPQVAPKFSMTSFGGGRPAGCTTCARWHAGVDLTSAPDGALVVAPLTGTIVGLNRGWDQSAKAIYLRTADGLFLVLGGVKDGSNIEFGVKVGDIVTRGQSLGRVIGWYGMIHLEAYADASKTRTGNSKWLSQNPAPAGLMNPTWLVQSMLGQPPALLTSAQRLAALRQLGWYAGAVDAPWGPAATSALMAAQGAYGLTPDGIWGPLTNAAIHTALGGVMPDQPAPAKPPAKPPDPPANPEPAPATRSGPIALAAFGLLSLWLVTR